MMLFVLACRVPIEDSAINSTIETGISEPESVAEPSNGDTSSAGEDIDGDGFTADVDCDDWDPAIHPDATEVLDYIDNNCDGVIDFDGVFSGVMTVEAVAIYEGNPYSFSQNCQAILDRDRGFANIATNCTIDLSQENADILLGEELFCDAETTALHEAQWQTQAVVRSSSGWDTAASLVASWSDLADNQGEEVTIQVSLESFSLDLEMFGTLKRESSVGE